MNRTLIQILSLLLIAILITACGSPTATTATASTTATEVPTNAPPTAQATEVKYSARADVTTQPVFVAEGFNFTLHTNPQGGTCSSDWSGNQTFEDGKTYTITMPKDTELKLGIAALVLDCNWPGHNERFVTPINALRHEDMPATTYELTDQGVKFNVESHEDFIAEHQDWCQNPSLAGGTWVHFPPNKIYVRIEFANVTYKVQMTGQVSGSDYVLQQGWLVGFVTEDRSAAAQALYCGPDVGVFLRITFG